MVLQVAGGRFLVGRRLFRCKSRAVHSGVDTHTGTQVVIKLELAAARHTRLDHEAKVYEALDDVHGIPRVFWCGAENGVSIMVVELKGVSLADFVECCGGRVSCTTVANVALQVLGVLERIHAKGYVHRDLRPETVLVAGGPKVSQLHLVGLTTTRRYRDPQTKEHVPYRENKAVKWNPAFASINTHLGKEPSRRDDLESLGYLAAYLFRSGLPWPADAPPGPGSHADILEVKQRLSVEELCEGCPPQLANFILCCRGLTFEGRPDYARLRCMLQGMGPQRIGKRLGKSLVFDDFAHDWTVRPAVDDDAAADASCPQREPSERLGPPGAGRS